MTQVIHINDLLTAIAETSFLWILIPIFFIGLITDKYQEEFGTSIGNAISNGSLVIFTGFSWLEIISSRTIAYPEALTASQYVFSLMLIIYGLTIIGSGFKTGFFAKKYGRVRVITFMLLFSTIMIYIPLLYNIISLLVFLLLFPFYYAFITELLKIMPRAIEDDRVEHILEEEQEEVRNTIEHFKKKMREYFS